MPNIPSVDLNEIKNRQEIVSDLISNSDVNLHSLLKNIIDLERLVSKLANGRVSPRELVNLKESLISCNEIKNIIISNELLRLTVCVLRAECSFKHFVVYVCVYVYSMSSLFF